MGNFWLSHPDREPVYKRRNMGGWTSPVSAHAGSHRTFFAEEAAKKVWANQSRIMAWDNIKDNPPRELKISPTAAIPHKSKAFCSILDLSFWLKLKNGGVLASVNDTMEKNRTKRGD